jgi:hypothetical protein
VRELFIDALGPEELQTLRRYSDAVVARIDNMPEQGGTANAGPAVRPASHPTPASDPAASRPAAGEEHRAVEGLARRAK